MSEKKLKRGIYSDIKVIDLGNKELIFVAGQIARDKNGAIAPDNIEVQTEFIFQSISKILKGAGSSLDDVVKAVIYLTNIENFLKISKVRDKYFEKAKPVSTLVEIGATTRPGCNIEIEVTAVRKK
ncbi:MAG: RidA family protein [Candidatus Komeilibacteria bacterium]|jgi:2-iminobutanoate/2-iminopropanoate deaminase|nr:RidA family protein [Candidatus Komeilibacteria bacterium]